MSLMDRINALPRAARWGVYGALVLVGYFAVVEPVLTLTERFETQAASARESLQRQRQLRQGKDQAAREIKSGIGRFGTVDFPLPLADAASRLQQRFNAVCAQFGVTPRSTAEASRSMGDAILSGVRPPGTRVHRHVQTVQLEASPETVLKIISALEQSPEVASLGQLQLRRSPKEGSKMVEATLNIEAWGLATAPGGGGGSGGGA